MSPRPIGVRSSSCSRRCTWPAASAGSWWTARARSRTETTRRGPCPRTQESRPISIPDQEEADAEGQRTTRNPDTMRVRRFPQPLPRRPMGREKRSDTMRLGLIGSTGHWQTYAPALARVPGLTLVAVAAAGPEETTGAFDHAPGLTVDTRRHDDAQKMLDTERLDVVQVACRPDRIPVWARVCLERGLPVMAEK